MTFNILKQNSMLKMYILFAMVFDMWQIPLNQV